MTLVQHSYGKGCVRMVKVRREGSRHDLLDLTVAIRLHGPFDASYLTGDNRNVIPTDTLKNTVYALGHDHPIHSLELFARHLAGHFISRHEHVESAEVELAAHPWTRLTSHAFQRGGPERDTCTVRVGVEPTTVSSGVADLTILKTTGSGFSDFLRDELTTLQDADDRILGTALTARWDYEPADAEYNTCRERIRAALVETFTVHESLSVQHTLSAMGERALEVCPGIARIHLAMPNKHCLLVDLSPFDRTNENEIFVPVDEPFGMIEATIGR